MSWEPDHLYFEGREGLVIRERRYYGEYAFGYKVLPAPAFRKVAAALDLEDPARVVPATRSQGDPDDVSEEEHLCKVTSGIPAYGPGDVPGGYHSISASFRTMEWRQSRDGMSASALAYGFDFSQDTDLMGGVETTSQQPQAWRTSLPYPKRLAKLKVVEAGDVTVRFYDAGNQQIGFDRTETLDDGGSMYLELPEGMREVEVLTSGSRPSLYLDQDTFALVERAQATGSITLESLGRGVWDETTYEHTTVMGNTVTLTKAVLKPDMLRAQRIRKSNAYAGYLTIDQ
jgi:hypothetical protein